MQNWPIHGTITGPIVMIGFGSIGRGTLPLIERHFISTSRASPSSTPTIRIAICSTSGASPSSKRP